jgi:hypothetical protein
MSICLALPSDLQAAVLVSWLEFGDVVNLDSAACSHSDRPQWLAFIYTPVYDFILPQFDFYHRYTFEEHKIKRIATYMRWVFNRPIRLDALYISSDMQVEEVAVQLRDKGRFVTKIGFAGNINYTPFVRRMLKLMLQYCPKITQLLCAVGFGSAGFRAVAQTWPQLQDITLPSGGSCCSNLAMAQNCVNLASVTIPPDRGSMTQREWRTFFETVNVNLQHICSYANLSNAVLEVVAQRLPQLRSLQGSYPHITDEVLLEFATHCPLLEALDMKSEEANAGNGLLAIVQNGRLRELNATWVSCGIPSVGGPHRHRVKVPDLIRAIADHCPELTHLKFHPFHSSHGVTYDTWVIPLVRNCQLLQQLDINLPLTAVTLSALAKHCHQLEFLELRRLRGPVSDAAVTALAQGCPKLRRLHVQFNAPVTMVGITALATHCRHLREVWVMRAVLGQTHRFNEQVMPGSRLTPVPYMD